MKVGVFATCLLLLVPALLVVAQEEKTRRDEPTRRQATAAARDTTSDSASQDLSSQFATALIIKNQEEIELAKFAMEKTQNDEVRQFAQKLIDDHTKFIEKLQQFNPQMEYATLQSEETLTSQRNRPGVRRQPNSDQPDQNQKNRNRQPDQPQPDQPQQDQANPDEAGGEDQAGRRERGEQAGEDEAVSVRRTTVAAPGDQKSVHLEVCRDAAQICLDMTKEKLGSKQGADFDRCWIGGQIVAHVGMIATLQAMQKHAPSELAQVLEQGVASASTHLKHAENLAQQLEGQPGTTRTGARQPKEGAAPDADRTERRNPDDNPNQ